MQSATQLVKKYSPLASITEENQEKFSDEMDEISYDDKPSIGEMIAYLNLIKSEISNEQGWPKDTPAAAAVKQTVEFMERVVGELVTLELHI